MLGGQLAERGVERYVMVVGCFLREGLVVSVTRFKRVDELPVSTRHAFDRICAVDACMQEASVPGATLGEVFQVCQDSYAAYGFAANEWHNHHQGGATGYAGRTAKGAPGGTPSPCWTASGRRRPRRSWANRWPSAAPSHGSAPGVESEDTFLLLPDGSQEIVSRTPSLPRIDLERVLGLRRTSVEKSGIA